MLLVDELGKSLFGAEGPPPVTPVPCRLISSADKDDWDRHCASLPRLLLHHRNQQLAWAQGSNILESSCLSIQTYVYTKTGGADRIYSGIRIYKK